jgi:hypothetical protein
MASTSALVIDLPVAGAEVSGVDCGVAEVVAALAEWPKIALAMFPKMLMDSLLSYSIWLLVDSATDLFCDASGRLPIAQPAEE